MAFWGIEVKPGKPVTHSFNEVRRRLRISQATLGIGTAMEKSLVQCNVGNKTPVFICALLPKKSESCHLDLEFEEADDVIFSVIGPRSVYLTGYYVGNYRHSALHSDTESYGEDIANTETEESLHDSEGDEYDDSFIDDGDPVVFPLSPVPNNEVTEEIVDKVEGERKGNKRLQRKIILSSNSDEQTASGESEDEENFPLSALMRKKAVKHLVTEVEEKTDEVKVERNEDINTTDSGSSVPASEEKVYAATLLQKTTSELGLLNNIKSKKRRKLDSDDVEGCMGNHEKALRQDKVLRPEAEGDSKHQGLLQPNGANQRITTKLIVVDGEIQGSLVHSASSVDGPSSKKRKKGGMKEKSGGSNGTTSNEIFLNDQLKENVIEAGKEVKDPPATTSEDKKPNADEDADFDFLADGSQPEEPKRKKQKEKTKKNKDNGNVSLLSVNESEKPSRPCQARSLSNGLVIEELAVGDQDGKIAVLERKVRIYYSGMLKESGRVIGSNIGKAPYKFRLGDEEIMEGWNLGIQGMRVGDKRRLTIPPSMGYGEQGDGKNVPPNSWLVFDIELVRVR